jgi:hypothetical protein
MTALCADVVWMLLVGKAHQIVPIYEEVATRRVDGGGWRLTRGECAYLPPPPPRFVWPPSP